MQKSSHFRNYDRNGSKLVDDPNERQDAPPAKSMIMEEAATNSVFTKGEETFRRRIDPISNIRPKSRKSTNESQAIPSPERHSFKFGHVKGFNFGVNTENS